MESIRVKVGFRYDGSFVINTPDENWKERFNEEIDGAKQELKDLLDSELLGSDGESTLTDFEFTAEELESDC